MIEDALGPIDYDESGSGPTLVLVPGSCSTGAAWRPTIAGWDGRFRSVTTSLLGYGGTAERRTPDDGSIDHEAAMLEAVVRRAGGPVHLVGHSFGGLVALTVALRGRVPLASLVVMEPPGVELLRTSGAADAYQSFRRMTADYFAAFEGGDADAIAGMIDFYGGAGTFASWPQRVRDYAVRTTPVNILDWRSAYGFTLSAAMLAAIAVPTLVVCGGTTHPAMRHLAALVARSIPGAGLATIEGAAHFMIATHAAASADLIAGHVRKAQAGL